MPHVKVTKGYKSFFNRKEYMKILQLKKGKKNTYLLKLDDGKEYSIYDDILVKYALLPKKEIKEEELTKIIKENQELESYYIALQYLTIKLRTKKELETYLKKKDYSKDAIEKTISTLEQQGYLKEEEYIQSFLHDMFRFSNDGPFKLKRKLMELGISEEKIEEQLPSLKKEEWISKLKNLWKKKATSKHNDGMYKWKQKCEMYFYNLGYPKDWIDEISSSYEWIEDNQTLEKEFLKLHKKWSRKSEGNDLIMKIKQKLYEKGFEKEKIDEVLTKYKLPLF